MTTIELDVLADIPSLRNISAQLAQAIIGPSGGDSVIIDLGGDDLRPGHLVLQLLASAALTRAAPGRRVAFGPRAAAEIARMDLAVNPPKEARP